MLRHREEARADGRRHSVVTYVLHTSGRVLARHPEANAAIRERWFGWGRPAVARYASVNGKLALDKTLGGRRVALSAVLRDLDTATLEEIQGAVDRYRDIDPDTAPEFTGARRLDARRYPRGLARYRKIARPLERRAALMGTFAVSSLGHRAVDGFHSVGGTTITLGVGRVTDRAVVRDGAFAVAPVMRLNLTFDHRVIDGAEAADVLSEIKDALEGFTVRPPAPAAVAEAAGEGRS
ncbi:2-oxo acid dehydrogenase subunit E2 [Streptomyces sp. NRRL F-5123]|uniref:2-oxo acid dehydrogenase subunit E2 n=1 Tax=Streptomyces sp. NRRL F-5123 TaxID=1463856 RepID=UPI000694D0CD|nr:2-oxo acid dehydrogenase subunit E2 [Streptomyces sp. NRRL F-5123]